MRVDLWSREHSCPDALPGATCSDSLGDTGSWTQVQLGAQVHRPRGQTSDTSWVLRYRRHRAPPLIYQCSDNIVLSRCVNYCAFTYLLTTVRVCVCACLLLLRILICSCSRVPCLTVRPRKYVAFGRFLCRTDAICFELLCNWHVDVLTKNRSLSGDACDEYLHEPL